MRLTGVESLEVAHDEDFVEPSQSDESEHHRQKYAFQAGECTDEHVKNEQKETCDVIQSPAQNNIDQHKIKRNIRLTMYFHYTTATQSII